MEPKVIVIISGKRKCGKDYFADKLQQTFSSILKPESSEIVRLSGPLKREYARLHNLSFEKLSDDSPYKENHRFAMVQWGEEVRQADPYYFCRLATSHTTEKSRIWIVSDVRRKSDLKYFDETFSNCLLLKIRISADENSRARRGWIFTPGVDDGETECDLDDAKIKWNYVIANNDRDLRSFDVALKEIADRCVAACHR